MQNAQNCDHLVLAKGPSGQVDYCPHCEVIHIHLPTVSLRVSPEACVALHAMLGKAVGQLAVDPTHWNFTGSSGGTVMG